MRAPRIAFDIMLLAFYLVTANPATTGMPLHEYLGVGVFVLMVAHVVMSGEGLVESQDPIKDFDFLGITIQYEMCYTNILQVLDLGGIPMLASERGENDPIVIGGRCCRLCLPAKKIPFPWKVHERSSWAYRSRCPQCP